MMFMGELMRIPLSPFTLNICLILLAAQAAIAQRYTIADLGTLPEDTGSGSIGTGINRSGQVTGYAFVSGPCVPACTHAFLFSHGNLRDLGTLPGGNTSVGNGINRRELRREPEGEYEHGRRQKVQVVGYSEVDGGDVHAFLYSGGVMQDLGTLPGGSTSVGNAIDRFGDITGNSKTVNGNLHAFLYNNGAMHDLGTLPGGTYSGGNGINREKRAWTQRGEGAQVVGIADVPGDCSEHLSCPYHAFLYRNGVMHDLGALPGGFFSSASGINRSGQVTGSADTSQGNFHAFLYDNGTMRDLGTLPNGFQSFGQAINKNGEIVGYGSVGSVSDYHAFVYKDGKMHDLNNLIPSNSGWFLGFAYAINDRGQITGSGIINGEGHAFLLTPICSENESQRDDNDGYDDEQRQ
jgi:probable HAF family extracellular repeat protein